MTFFEYLSYFSYFWSKKKKMEDKRKVIHLQKGGKDYYFGSLAALFATFDKDELGVSYGSIRNYHITPDKPYSNKLITIKEGVLISAKGNRGSKKDLSTDV